MEHYIAFSEDFALQTKISPWGILPLETLTFPCVYNLAGTVSQSVTRHRHGISMLHCQLFFLIKTGALLMTVPSEDMRYQRVLYSLDGNHVVCGMAKGEVRILDSSNGSKVRQQPTPQSLHVLGKRLTNAQQHRTKSKIGTRKSQFWFDCAQ